MFKNKKRIVFYAILCAIWMKLDLVKASLNWFRKFADHSLWIMKKPPDCWRPD
jgi:hypothetical protein